MLLAERTELVTKSLGELPAQYREVLVLRELEQLSYREIATVAGIPLGTVMSRLSWAREHLEQTLLDYVERGELDVAIRTNAVSRRTVRGGDTMSFVPESS